MRILVTGGGGFIGKALSIALKKEGHEVISLSRSYYPELEDYGIDQIQADILDRNLLFSSLKDIDLVYHVAAKAGFWGPCSEYYRTNVLGTFNIIDACRRGGVKHLVFTSSASVVFDGKDIIGGSEDLPYPGKPLSYYTETKAIAEKAVLQANSEELKTMALRPHLVWGPGDRHIMPRIIEQARSGKLRIIGRGDNIIDLTHIDNCTHAHLCALRSIQANPAAWGSAYFISDGEPVRLWDMVNSMLQANGIDPLKKRFHSGMAMAAARIMEKAKRPDFSSEPPRITSFLVHELTSSHWFDISAARKNLGYSPVISAEEGLKRIAEDTESQIATAGGIEGVLYEEELPEEKIITLDYLKRLNHLEGRGLTFRSLRFAIFYLRKTSQLLKKGAGMLGNEALETKQMANIFFRMLEARLDLKNRKEPPTAEEVKEAINQLKDVGRFSFFATVSILPGGGFSLIGLELLARKFGIKGFTLVPSSFRKA